MPHFMLNAYANRICHMHMHGRTDGRTNGDLLNLTLSISHLSNARDTQKSAINGLVLADFVGQQ